MQSTWNKGSWHVVDFIMKSQKFNVTSFILTEIDQARKKGFPQESSLCTTHHENDIEQESAPPASSFAPHFQTSTSRSSYDGNHEKDHSLLPRLEQTKRLLFGLWPFHFSTEAEQINQMTMGMSLLFHLQVSHFCIRSCKRQRSVDKKSLRLIRVCDYELQKAAQPMAWALSGMN